MPKTKSNITPINEREIAEEAIRLGIKPDILGYRYLVEAVQIKLENPNMASGAVNEAIAEKYGTRDTRVERAIRHAVKCANEIDNEAWQGFCRSCFPGNMKPNNSFVIAVLAERHRLRRVS